MLHPALARALATAHIEDLHRAAARRHTIRLARRAARESRVWPLQPPNSDPRRLGYVDAARPRRTA